jgi:hypothetical protein
MKAMKDERLDAFEDLAMESIKQVRAYYTYQGEDPKPFKKARIACAAISAFSRIRSTETNRMAVELATTKMLGLAEPPMLTEPQPQSHARKS